MDKNQENKNDGKMTAIRSSVLIIIAVFFDAAQIIFSIMFNSMSGLAELVALIPFVGWALGPALGGVVFAVGAMINLILSIYAVLTFFILLKLWKYKSAKVFMALFAAFVVEEIPLGNNLPFWTVWAIKFILNDYKKQAEEKVFDKAPGAQSLKALAA